ncbi:MAG: hypothetical protein HZA90_05450 [Verrucomicrobia bacterium]|nr:hypothetical protein [Verrucomicrobiota bacterium]
MTVSEPHDGILFRRLRWLTGLFIVGLVLSGATAMPVERELDWLANWLGASDQSPSSLGRWVARVQLALRETNARHPFIAYGFDWLAFGHFVIALAFVWAWREPVRNRWMFDFGLVACALVVPWALVLGAVRGIPWGWRLIDCAFGFFGAVPLWLCRRYARELAERK